MGNAGDLLAAAFELAAIGAVLEQRGRHGDAVPAMQQAYSACLIAASDLPTIVMLRPPAEVPEIAHPEHYLVRLGPQSLRVLARDDGLHQGLSHLRRLSLFGTLIGAAARRLAGGGEVECVIDISDGSDCGCYRRFAFCSTSPDTVLIPDPFFFESSGYDTLRREVAAHARPWAERRDVVFWRGGATGALREGWSAPGEPPDLRRLPRLSLCLGALAISESGRVDIGVSSVEQIGRSDIRQQAEAAGLVRKRVDKSAFMDYRYLIDIDGNTNSWCLLEKMIMGSTILKVASAEGFRQWYYDRLEPWIHYIPVAADLADFADAVDWAFAHPQECEAVAANAAYLADELGFHAVMREAEARFALGLAQSGVALV